MESLQNSEALLIKKCTLKIYGWRFWQRNEVLHVIINTKNKSYENMVML